MEKSFVVKNVNNPNFCGEDAGGVQFANGEATISDGRMASWFTEHDGYSVEEVGGDTNAALKKMRVEELKAYAAEKGIDLGDASKKEDILAKIAAAEASA